MKFTKTNQTMLLLLTFSLAFLAEIANKKIAQADHDYRGHTNNFIGSKLTNQCLRDTPVELLRDRYSLKLTKQSFSPSITLFKQSSKQSTIQDDLQFMLAGRAWVKEKTQEYPFRIILQLRNQYELTIQSTEFASTDKPEPIFPFFNFELQQREGKRFIASVNGNVSKPSTSKIYYQLQHNRLIIKSGVMTVQYKGGQKEVDLRGEYTPWFSPFRS